MHEQVERLLENRLMSLVLIPFAFWLVWMVEWVQNFAGSHSNLRFLALLSLLVTLYSGFQIFRLHPQLRRFRRSKPGGRKLTEILDRIRSRGFVAYPTLAEEGADVDHVLVGPSGVYLVETKAWAAFGSRTIDHETENELLVGGRITDSRPLQGARSAARAVRTQLEEHLHELYPVKPLVVFLGDWDVNRHAVDTDVAVMAADQLENFLERQQPELTGKEIAHICSHLERSGKN